MPVTDEAFIRAKLLRELRELEPEPLFEKHYTRIQNLIQTHDPCIIEELIQLCRVFVEFSTDRNYEDKCRAVYACEGDDQLISWFVHTWFTDYDPYRTGVPMAEDQNAQMMITQPRGIQRARARQNNRSDNEALLRSPFPDVIEILCANPAVGERDILFMASRRPTQNHLLEPLIASRWIVRPEVRFALAANPYIKTSHALRCTFTLSAAQLALLADMNELHPQLRAHADRLASRR